MLPIPSVKLQPVEQHPSAAGFPVKTKQQATLLCGGLSKPSKMPGYAYGLSPQTTCATGAKLAKIPGTACSTCYALKGNYRFANVAATHQRREATLTNPLWAEAVAFLIARTNTHYFRWHDAGDITSTAHLHSICRVAWMLPEVSFWLPTQERGLIGAYQKRHVMPPNLVVRVSSVNIDEPCMSNVSKHASAVVTKARAEEYTTARCPAPTQGNQCGLCRKCWDQTVPLVVYTKH